MKREYKEIEGSTCRRVYVADDGEEFHSLFACLEHDRGLKVPEARSRVEKLPQFEMTPPFVWRESRWVWYFVQSQRDVTDIATVFFHVDSVAHEFKPFRFPCWVAAVMEDEDTFDCGGHGRMMEYDQYVTLTNSFYDLLRTKMASNGTGLAEIVPISPKTDAEERPGNDGHDGTDAGWHG